MQAQLRRGREVKMVNIKHSRYMDISPLGKLEQYICRVPKNTRKKLGITLGDSIRLRIKHLLF